MPVGELCCQSCAHSGPKRRAKRFKGSWWMRLCWNLTICSAAVYMQMHDELRLDLTNACNACMLG